MNLLYLWREDDVSRVTLKMTNFAIFTGQRENVYLLEQMGMVLQTLDHKRGLALCGKMWMILDTLVQMSNILETFVLIKIISQLLGQIMNFLHTPPDVVSVIESLLQVQTISATLVHVENVSDYLCR